MQNAHPRVFQPLQDVFGLCKRAALQRLAINGQKDVANAQAVVTAHSAIGVDRLYAKKEYERGRGVKCSSQLFKTHGHEPLDPGLP